MIQVIDGSTGTATRDEMSEITAFNNQLRDNGHYVMAEGLQSPNESLLIDNRDGANEITEGPLQKSTEYVSGFWIIEADNLDQAKIISQAASLACNRKVELRPFIQ